MNTNRKEIENRYLAPAVCGLLLLMVAVVFGQTVQHEFINFDDDEYVYDNPHVAHGLTSETRRLVVHRLPRQQLASADVALPRARLPTLRDATRPAGTT